MSGKATSTMRAWFFMGNGWIAALWSPGASCAAAVCSLWTKERGDLCWAIVWVKPLLQAASCVCRAAEGLKCEWFWGGVRPFKVKIVGLLGRRGSQRRTVQIHPPPPPSTMSHELSET